MTRLPNTKFHHNALLEHGVRERTRYVVIHTIQGTDEGAEAWFKDRASKGIGAHVIIGQEPTHNVQTIDLDQIAYHAMHEGNHNGIGIEHEGFAETSRVKWLGSSNRNMLRRSANRTAWICYHYKLGTPKHKVNVLGHVDVPGNDHTDPGPGFPWFFYIFLCKRAYKKLQASNGKSWA